MSEYSIIIPTLNEEDNIQRLLQHLKSFKKDKEIIIVDGGSGDNTLKLAESFGVKICKSPPGKGKQLNEGTKHAKGKILIYLHADTFLPTDAFNLVQEYFSRDEVRIATFKLSFDSNNFFMKTYCRFTNFDSMFTTFGDQAIIAKKEFINEMGGFPNIRIFEDVEFFRNVRKRTKIYKLPASVITSGRRFYKKGIITTQLLNIYFFILYLLKVSPDKIYKRYFYDKF